MAPADNLSTDISEQLHNRNVEEAYRSTDNVCYIRQMLEHNDWSTSLAYMDKTLSYPALKSCNDIDLANVFNLLSSSNKWRNMLRAHVLDLQHYQDETFFRPASPQVHHLRDTHVRGVCRSIKLT
jgi:hypothetical protein